MKRGRLLGIVMAGGVAATVLVIATPTHAGPGCGTPFNGFDISAEVRETTRTLPTSQGTRTLSVQLVNGRVFDESRAVIADGYRPGDLVWIERSYDEKQTRTRCGPFSASSSNEQDNIGAWMRACASTKEGGVAGGVCTRWYFDHD
ncbi:hypothetical protein Psi02_70030 [Planotetraspora silvatica]|uniref:Secreted protein n=1 Tax=Planotetraspora silvatica TaxID=234614 RepID=A0A8J3UY59_9ACTN|nr:hypothetical protein [Planotetraspora silvatica]GII50579.1 hypothetical protein Psi02_70030 [Planotetraspora silvatica]